MLKLQTQLSQYDRCQTQRPKEFKECRPFQIYQSALGLPRQLAAVFPPFKSARGSPALIGRFEKVSFNLIEIFRPKLHLNVQFSELYS